jgi:pyridoxamine 5'-phosphate oxidase
VRRARWRRSKRSCGKPDWATSQAASSPYPAAETTISDFPNAQNAGDPLELFRDWFAAATAAEPRLPEAASLATATRDGVPSARMVLMKGYDARGFVFFTNYESRKSRELIANPRAAMLFHWGSLERQVRLEGPVSRISQQESEAYFATRDRRSQLGAWASEQSRELASREELERRFADADLRFQGRHVPLPTYWGGYRIAPLVMEFWQGRANRLHDRLVFTRERPDDAWRASHLYP